MKKYLPDIGYTLLFGMLSLLFGLARFPVPGTGEVYSDLREIPMLISVFYLSNPLFLVVLSIITALSTFIYGAGYFSSTVIMHAGGLVITWYFYRKIIDRKMSTAKTGIYWTVWVAVYYAVLVVPIMIAVDLLLENDMLPFFEAYASIIPSLPFEAIATAMVTTSYLIQIQMAKDLKKINLTLEDRIAERTDELNALNEQLRFSHQEIMQLNENLEMEVADRTANLRVQLEKLNAYAFSNSHEVRGPLARILGLLHLLDLETEVPRKEELFKKIHESALELDAIIRKMNRILEAENLLDAR